MKILETNINIQDLVDCYRKRGEYQTLYECIGKAKGYRELSEALETLQRRCSSRLIEVRNILDAILKVENKLDIKKTPMLKTKVFADLYGSNEQRSHAYRYSFRIPESTQFTAVFCQDGWKIVELKRDKITNSPLIQIELSESAKKAILRKFKTV